MKVIVTGGAGFIGSYIVDKLIQLGISIVILDDLSSGSSENIQPGVVHYEINIVDKRLEEIFELVRPDAVVHQAAQVNVGNSISHPLIDANTNIIGTLNILECCRKFNVKRIVYASSAAAYGDPKIIPVSEEHPLKPMSMYGVSKVTAEFYVFLYHRMFNLQYMILRYANVYGPRQTIGGDGAVVPTFTKAMLQGKSPVIYGDGRQTRDFINVHDVAAANLAALQMTESGVFNISSGTSTEIRTLYEMLAEITGCDVLPQFEPARNGDIQHSELDNQHARNVLKWAPIHSLQNGLTETTSYYKKLLKIKPEIFIG